MVPGTKAAAPPAGKYSTAINLPAAHASLPLGSYVRVTVQDTGRSIVVKVNDREPPHGVRCIDLSRAAAVSLGIAGRGVADVTLAAATREDAVEEEVAEAPETPVHHHAVSSRRGPRHRRHAHR